MVNKIVIFEISGKFACFKKFYTNSSSFTSFVPSRTNLIGLIASILELPRDSYYNELNSKNCKVGVEIISDLKKNFHCLNYFKKPNQRVYTQVRLEILTNNNIKEDKIKYRIYLWFKDNYKFKLNDFIEKIKNNNLGFGVYLGQRQFRGNLNFIEVIENIEIIENKINQISTVTNIKNLKNREEIIYDNSEIYFEKIPFDFEFVGKEEELETNSLNRDLKSIGEIIYNKNYGSLLKVKSSFNKVYKINFLNEEKYISFYEEL